MTLKEALDKVRSEPKWYWEKGDDGDYNPNPRLIDTAKRIEHGLCKPETVESFFAKFRLRVEVTMQVIEEMEVAS